MTPADTTPNITPGDLTRRDAFDLFKRAMEKNVLQGLVAGPPCETCRRARGQALSDGSAGPRVIRTNARPYGKIDLTKKEDDQDQLWEPTLSCGSQTAMRCIGVCLKGYENAPSCFCVESGQHAGPTTFSQSPKGTGTKSHYGARP